MEINPELMENVTPLSFLHPSIPSRTSVLNKRPTSENDSEDHALNTNDLNPSPNSPIPNQANQFPFFTFDKIPSNQSKISILTVFRTISMRCVYVDLAKAFDTNPTRNTLRVP